MTKDHFERLVHQAVLELPREFRDRLHNVAVTVEDEPSAELREQMELESDDTLFGLYEGTPLTERGSEPPLYPDRIWIFRKPIERACRDDREIVREIKITVAHEIAHFFGMDDDYLEEIGY